MLIIRGVLLLCVCVAFVMCDGETQPEIPIISQKSSIEPDGAYAYSFESGDGTKVEEIGEVRQIEDEQPIVAHGSYSYQSPDDGKTYTINYVADENGYQPTGDHLPVAPEIPPMIKKALEYLATAPPPKDE